MRSVIDETQQTQQPETGVPEPERMRVANEYLASNLSAADFFPRRGIRVPGPRGLRFAFYRMRVAREALEILPAQTAVRLVYSSPDSQGFDVALGYSQLSRTLLARHSRLFPIHEGSSRLFVRQSGKNRMFLTVRENNVTDTVWCGVKILAARIAALVHRKNTVLLYEKESSRYEESAAVVFEALVDGGHHDVYFLLAAEKIDSVPERYRSRVIKRFSFRHFYHFFAARTFIGTELLAHAIELRTINRFLLQHLSAGKFGFVFLQHGVMYMVALSSTQRSFFRSDATFPDKTRIVCSSELEKRHFVELAGFSPENMYVSGLPKFDHATLDDDADRILIMPTWRPWEYNTIRTNSEKSGYFAMLRQMYEAVPDHLKDRAWILPHPLVRESLKSTSLGTHVWAGDSFDAALRRGRVLVTDYSSIAYDAFYRGANVVFWWKDKDECMDRYGGHLMLDEGTAFGPVCYDAAALSDAIGSSFTEPQTPEHLRRYEQIVEFKDGHNTQRLIEMMTRDQMV
jgi:CDP-glycerol glycerophosphotransferase (TagB/SpsB family)